MVPDGTRLARVVARDVRIGDELRVGYEWRRVLALANDGTTVEITCDEPSGRGPHSYWCREPVLVRWAVPTTTIALARDLRRGHHQ